MMIGRTVRKVPGGKLLKVTVEYEGIALKSVRVNGDFFAHPEDGIERLEKRLAGVKVEDVDGVVTESLKDVELYGVDVRSITDAILEAAG